MFFFLTVAAMFPHPARADGPPEYTGGYWGTTDGTWSPGGSQHEMRIYWGAGWPYFPYHYDFGTHDPYEVTGYDVYIPYLSPFQSFSWFHTYVFDTDIYTPNDPSKPAYEVVDGYWWEPYSWGAAPPTVWWDPYCLQLLPCPHPQWTSSIDPSYNWFGLKIQPEIMGFTDTGPIAQMAKMMDGRAWCPVSTGAPGIAPDSAYSPLGMMDPDLEASVNVHAVGLSVSTDPTIVMPPLYAKVDVNPSSALNLWAIPRGGLPKDLAIATQPNGPPSVPHWTCVHGNVLLYAGSGTWAYEADGWHVWAMALTPSSSPNDTQLQVSLGYHPWRGASDDVNQSVTSTSNFTVLEAILQAEKSIEVNWNDDNHNNIADRADSGPPPKSGAANRNPSQTDKDCHPISLSLLGALPAGTGWSVDFQATGESDRAKFWSNAAGTQRLPGTYTVSGITPTNQPTVTVYQEAIYPNSANASATSITGHITLQATWHLGNDKLVSTKNVMQYMFAHITYYTSPFEEDYAATPTEEHTLHYPGGSVTATLRKDFWYDVIERSGREGCGKLLNAVTAGGTTYGYIVYQTGGNAALAVSPLGVEDLPLNDDGAARFSNTPRSALDHRSNLVLINYGPKCEAALSGNSDSINIMWLADQVKTSRRVVDTGDPPGSNVNDDWKAKWMDVYVVPIPRANWPQAWQTPATNTFRSNIMTKLPDCSNPSFQDILVSWTE